MARFVVSAHGSTRRVAPVHHAMEAPRVFDVMRSLGIDARVELRPDATPAAVAAGKRKPQPQNANDFDEWQQWHTTPAPAAAPAGAGDVIVPASATLRDTTARLDADAAVAAVVAGHSVLDV